MRIVTRSVVVGLAMSAVACGEGGGRLPTLSTPPTTAPSPPPSTSADFQPVRVVSGADTKPVAGASVLIEGSRFVSDENGRVTPDPLRGAALGASIDVDAPGYLPRRTRIDHYRTVILWPVADAAEEEAVHEMVYRWAGPRQAFHPPDPGPFLISFLDARSLDPGVADAWSAEAMEFGDLLGLNYVQSYSFQYEQNEIAVRFSETGACDPLPSLGFCRDSHYYKSFLVLPGKARDPQTIRRVLVSWFLGPNPLPGFLNRSRPADQLSPLEMQTLRMLFMRPLPNRWPDTDR